MHQKIFINLCTFILMDIGNFFKQEIRIRIRIRPLRLYLMIFVIHKQICQFGLKKNFEMDLNEIQLKEQKEYRL